MERIELTGAALRPAQVARIASGDALATVAPGALAYAAESADAARRIAARRPLYGRSTGVGANRTQAVAPGDGEHGLRLLRSHAGGIGRPVPDAGVRAMLAVRANQLLAGGAGLRPEIIEAIVAALNADALPRVHEFGGLGTADLTALAELGLALVGERPWSAPGPGPTPITPGDALALMSSSALTIGTACLAWSRTAVWMRAAHAVAALSFVALDGSPEPFAEAVHDRRPHPGSVRSARFLRALLAGREPKAARIQDPFALRCLPQIHGVALTALDTLEQVLAVEANAAAENPLISALSEDAFHHGGFHQGPLTQALDALNLALLSVGHLSIARVNMLFQPEFTGLRPFLAHGEPASSGVMILENAAHGALAEMRNAAMPAGLGQATLSRGVEDHTPFTGQAVRHAERSAGALRLILGTELVAATRALRLRGILLDGDSRVAAVFRLASVLDHATADRSTTADVHAAADLLPALADLAG